MATQAGKAENQKFGRGRATATLDIIATIVEIAEIYQPCSVRALAYQLFNRKLIASMGKNDTQKVSRWCTIAREEGTLPWEWITDTTRKEEEVSTWADPAAYARAVQNSYRRNKWAPQPTHVAVWSEKSTVEGTLRPVLNKYEVPFQSVHGWCGATTVHDAADANLRRDQSTLILYVGDYDPSGMGMSEVDLPKRLARYSSDDPTDRDMSPEVVSILLEAARLRIRRVTLTAEDTRALGMATAFPAADKKGTDEKKGDSRYKWFVANYGHWCWELDALSPTVLRARVEAAIVAELDQELWERYALVERAEQEAITKTCETWKSILRQDPK